MIKIGYAVERKRSPKPIEPWGSSRGRFLSEESSRGPLVSKTNALSGLSYGRMVDSKGLSDSVGCPELPFVTVFVTVAISSRCFPASFRDRAIENTNSIFPVLLPRTLSKFSITTKTRRQIVACMPLEWRSPVTVGSQKARSPGLTL